jgi:hypothetical protein
VTFWPTHHSTLPERAKQLDEKSCFHRGNSHYFLRLYPKYNHLQNRKSDGHLWSMKNTSIVKDYHSNPISKKDNVRVVMSMRHARNNLINPHSMDLYYFYLSIY